MKKLILPAIIFTTAMAANAACYGSGAYRTCSDESGNTYNVQRYGNTTNVKGYNAQDGNHWNQSSQTFGNTTITNGTAANGSHWNSTTISSPGITQQFGTDSHGKSFSKTCTQYGCN